MNSIKISIGLIFIFGIFFTQSESKILPKNDSRLPDILHQWYELSLSKVLAGVLKKENANFPVRDTRKWKLKNGEKDSLFYRFLSLYG